MYKFRYIYEKFPNGELTLLGIQIDRNCVVSTRMYSLNYPDYEAVARGVEECDHRFLVLTRAEMDILRKHYAEFNSMLCACQANFTLPVYQTCWQRKDESHIHNLEAADFLTGTPMHTNKACALYKYIW